MPAIQQRTITPMHPPQHCLPVPSSTGTAHRVYNLVAIDITDDENLYRPILALRRHLPVIEHLRQRLGTARQHHTLLRPLVIRATVGERILVNVTNQLAAELLNVILVEDNGVIQMHDTVGPLKRGETRTLLWHCLHAGEYPIYNQAALSMAEHCQLLGLLIVEP